MFCFLSAVFKCDGLLLFHKSTIILAPLCNLIYSFISILSNCREPKSGITCNLIGKHCRAVLCCLAEICATCTFTVTNILYDSAEMVGSFWNELLLSQYKLINVVYLFHNLKLVCVYEVFVILFSHMCAFLVKPNPIGIDLSNDWISFENIY